VRELQGASSCEAHTPIIDDDLALQKQHPEQMSHEWLVKDRMIPLGEFLHAIRKNIDHQNRQISNIDIWRPFVSDLDPIIAAIKRKG
jgi:hypothetical protein